MTTNEILIAALHALTSRLRLSGKHAPATFFEAARERLRLAPNDQARHEVAAEIARSGKVVELANFNRSEEQAFDVVHASAKTLLGGQS